MYTCGACGGIIEELGEMAVSSGGCVCAQKKAEESANSLQQLKAEIAALIPELRAAYGLESEVNFENCLETMRQLSAV
jgi:hypothetical protein